jgi:hypothetical protein
MIDRVDKIYVGLKNKIFWAVFVTYLLRQYLKLTINSLQGFEEATSDTS